MSTVAEANLHLYSTIGHHIINWRSWQHSAHKAKKNIRR